MSQLHARMLERAAGRLGGSAEVARYLAVPEACIRVWLGGVIAPPDEVFLKLVDLINEAPRDRLSFAVDPERRGMP